MPSWWLLIVSQLWFFLWTPYRPNTVVTKALLNSWMVERPLCPFLDRWATYQFFLKLFPPTSAVEGISYNFFIFFILPKPTAPTSHWAWKHLGQKIGGSVKVYGFTSPWSQSQIGWIFKSKANESYCLYNSGPMVRHHALMYGFHTLPNMLIKPLREARYIRA